MTLFYSSETNGFYDDALWPHALPADAVEVTAEQHLALLAAASEGRQIAAADDGRPVDVAAAAPSAEAVAASVRRQRDTAIADVRWMIERHTDEVALGVAPSLSSAEFIALLQHVQALRDVPSQSGFPAAITWPEPPAFITTQEPVSQ